jgi:hypothetical protein
MRRGLLNDRLGLRSRTALIGSGRFTAIHPRLISASMLVTRLQQFGDLRAGSKPLVSGGVDREKGTNSLASWCH